MLVDVRDLTITYRSGSLVRPRHVVALDHVRFGLAKGRTLGVVGESGSGKSTLCRAVIGLIPLASGTVRLDGMEITPTSKRDRRELSRHAHLVFQDSHAAMNPRLSVADVLREPFRAHGIDVNSERLAALLDDVQLPRSYLSKRPLELSGGERQRVAIARGLALRPALLLLDEPVSALDVSTQADLLELLARLQIEHELTYILVSHDLAVVQRLAHDILVLYAGSLVEFGHTASVLGSPRHPYTRALIEAVPRLDRPLTRATSEQPVESSLASAATTGCPYHPRCPLAIETCRSAMPPLVDDGHHAVACYRADEIAETGRGKEAS